MRKLKPGIDFIGVTIAFYCNDGEGNFLLHKRGQNARDEKGMWDFGGGQLDFGEEVADGMMRELFEEYGIKGEIQEQVPAHSVIRTLDNVKTHWIAMPFFVKVAIGKAKIMEPLKVDAIGIFKIDNFPKPFHSGATAALKKYKEYFDRYR